ncbi:methyltransferase domain-containing protein [Aquimarina litoralis]|uniref:methyltransferase domain-containing protein n=1 Tax=Aquimarina litoralis TaxID=584605 RepID=UPI001C562ED3|nr:methyltransferase domain-containing protein [Aquimarina litoralis]MBW1298361.1 methyltransferase domain-containing protein [Aquimarina litoralis]
MLVNLTKRSNEAELMDNPDVNEKDLSIALEDIGKVNRMLGGNNITIDAVVEIIKNDDIAKEYTIMDFGCGDGEMLRQLAKVLQKHHIKAKLIGIDNHDKCLSQAINLSGAFPDIKYYQENILQLDKEKFSCDIIICTLTLHHFRDEEIKKLLTKGLELASQGIIINDIHRTRLSYYLFKLFSFFFIKGYIAKNDGLVSIKRGFKRNELLRFAKDLKLTNHRLQWKWAFRYRWIINQ